MSDEPPALGGPMGNNLPARRAGPQAVFPVEVRIPGLEEASRGIQDLNEQLRTLQTTLTSLSSTQASMATGLNQMFKGIQQNATAAASAVGSVGAAMGGSGGGGGGGGGGAGWWGGGGGARAAGLGIASVLSGAMSCNLMKVIAMFPLRFMQTTLNTNRQLAMLTNQVMGGTQFATGMNTGAMMNYLAGLPGSVMGSPEDILSLQAIARQTGALVQPGMVMGGQPVTGRGPGFFEAVRQAQLMMPGTPVSELAGTIGGFAAGPGQQQAAYLTGGAFAMLAPGGGMKTISQWAEGILRWLEGQRPGNKRGVGFTYGEILSQYFPGSNIDAWLSVNGVPPNMREYFWNYALGKAQRNQTTGGAPLIFGTLTQPGVEEQESIAFQRLQATSALTRTGFGLGGAMHGSYANRETANRWFNEMMGQAIRDLIPSRIASGPLAAMQFMPDTVEELLMTLLERAPNLVGTLLGGAIGWGPGLSMFPNLASTFAGSFGQISGGTLTALGLPENMDWSALLQQEFGLGGGGDVGDPGVAGWGLMGGSTLAGLHPDMKRKVGAMMRANPRLRITSGLRNTVQQQNLRKRGHSRVSGKPSAHTRGLAADLGPSSEYGWIAANAKKFGLASGAGVGEPWHVGLGDTVGGGGGLGSLLSLLTGVGGTSQEGVITGIGTIIPAVLNLLFGAFGGEPMAASESAALLAFKPDLYTTLRGIMPTDAQGNIAITGGAFGGMGFTGPNDYIPIGPDGSPGPAGAASPQAIFDYLKQNGVSSAAAAGILANIRYESNFDPFNDTGDGGTSGGLFQHHAGRWAALKNYATSTNRHWTNWKAQVDYALIEARQMGINLNATSPQAAAREWTLEFERPANAQAQADKRAAVADQYMLGDIEAALMGGGGSVRINNPTFNNTFIIQGGGGGPQGGGGVDVRRAVTQIADQLEEEMRRRVARSN